MRWLDATMPNAGFTLLEVLVSMGIITLLFAMSLPVYVQFQTRDDLDNAVHIFAQAARRAQQLAQSSDNDTAWGLKYAAGTITIYRGATDATGNITFATRTSSADDTLAVPSSITPSGTSEFDYAYLSGNVTTGSGGTLTLTATDGTTRTATINAKGMVDWQ